MILQNNCIKDNNELQIKYLPKKKLFFWKQTQFILAFPLIYCVLFKLTTWLKSSLNSFDLYAYYKIELNAFEIKFRKSGRKSKSLFLRLIT